MVHHEAHRARAGGGDDEPVHVAHVIANQDRRSGLGNVLEPRFFQAIDGVHQQDHQRHWRYLQERPAAVVTLRTRRGRLAQISASRRAAYGYDQRFEVLGSGGMLQAGKEPVVEASIVKDIGTVWEQQLPHRVRDLAAFVEETATNRETLENQLSFAIKTAPKLTIQGGTTEVLRGIIARGLGLR